MTTPSTFIPLQFWPPKSLKLPKRKFRGKGEERGFWADWWVTDWLHYNISKDAAFCYLCIQADHQNKGGNPNQLLYKLHSHTGKKLFLCANRALTADFQSLSLYSIAILCSESTRFNLRAGFFQKFSEGHAPRPPRRPMLCISECALHTAGEPTHRNLNFILSLCY